jgi:hypothetical protein
MPATHQLKKDGFWEIHGVSAGPGFVWLFGMRNATAPVSKTACLAFGQSHLRRAPFSFSLPERYFGVRTVLPFTGLNSLTGVAVDGSGTVYVADTRQQPGAQTTGRGAAPRSMCQYPPPFNDPVGLSLAEPDAIDRLQKFRHKYRDRAAP